MDFSNPTVDSLSTTERLHLSILHGTKSICKAVEESSKPKVTFDKDAVALISELVWKKLQEMGFDLEHFAKHAKRTTIKPPDVLLLARRNPSLRDHLSKLVKVEERRKRRSDGTTTEVQEINAVEAENELNVEHNDDIGKIDKDLSEFHPLSDDDLCAFGDDIID